MTSIYRMRAPAPVPRAAIPLALSAYVSSGLRRMAMQQDRRCAEQALVALLSAVVGADRADVHYQRVDRAEIDRLGGLAIVQPLMSLGRPLGLLVVVRERGPELAAKERSLVGVIAAHAAPILEHFLRKEQMRRAAAPTHPVFRSEAVRANVEREHRGSPVSPSSAWTGRTYKVLVAAVAVCVLGAWCISIDRYSSGPAVVRIEGTRITAPYPGSVESIEVEPGAAVAAGDVLIRMSAQPQRVALAQARQEYERELAQFLLDRQSVPSSALADLAANHRRAQAALEERVVRADRPGVVREIRVHPGQRIEPGDPMLTVTRSASRPVVIALLPGSARPVLEVGDTLQLELQGFDQRRQSAVIEWIGQDVVGPREAARYLGADIADSVAIRGPVVLVRARLSADVFAVDDVEYHYYDGMHGLGEVKVGSERVLYALMPGHY